MPSRARWTTLSCLLIALPAFAAVASGTDGVLEINQAQALAGGVTPADAPGFPVTLGESGAYVLTGNLVVPDADTDAIEIAARHVSIDLNGFAILGPTICNVGASTSCANTGTGRGIYNAVAAWMNATVRNGSIRGVGGDAITLGFGAYVEKVQIASNGGTGIVAGNGCVISGNLIRGNGGSGITAVQGNTITDNAVLNNVGDGIAVAAFNAVTGNTVSDNLQIGIETGIGSTVTGNTVGGNDGVGLSLASTTGYGGNVIHFNGGTVVSGVEIGTNLCEGSTTCP